MRPCVGRRGRSRPRLAGDAAAECGGDPIARPGRLSGVGRCIRSGRGLVDVVEFEAQVIVARWGTVLKIQ